MSVLGCLFLVRSCLFIVRTTPNRIDFLFHTIWCRFCKLVHHEVIEFDAGRPCECVVFSCRCNIRLVLLAGDTQISFFSLCQELACMETHNIPQRKQDSSQPQYIHSLHVSRTAQWSIFHTIVLYMLAKLTLS